MSNPLVSLVDVITVDLGLGAGPAIGTRVAALAHTRCGPCFAVVMPPLTEIRPPLHSANQISVILLSFYECFGSWGLAASCSAQVEQHGGAESSSSVVLFQASNGSPVMRFSNATHVCVLGNASVDDEINDDDAERAFAVVRLIGTSSCPSTHVNDEGHDMFTDIPMDASASVLSGISVTALVVMHDLAVSVRSAAASLPAPSPILPIPKMLPAASHKYVLSYNSRLRRGQEASVVTALFPPDNLSLAPFCT